MLPDPTAFSQEWVEAWNSHDVERVLAHFSDDVEFSSPVAKKLLPDTLGFIRGKDQLRQYWTRALEKMPNLKFEVVAVYTGVSTIVITYRNHLGNTVNEVLIFSDELVVKGHGTYLTPIS